MPCRSVACCDTRLPLSPHCNPSSVLKKDSLGVFHYRLSAPYPLLQIWFRGTVLITFGRKAMLTPTPIPTQGRLLCTQHLRRKGRITPHCRFKSASCRNRLPQGSTLPHNSRSPQKQGRIFHAIGKRPGSAGMTSSCLPPAPTPNWA